MIIQNHKSVLSGGQNCGSVNVFNELNVMSKISQDSSMTNAEQLIFLGSLFVN